MGVEVDIVKNRINEAIIKSKAAQELMHRVYTEELDKVVKDKKFLEQEQKFLDQIKKVETELREITANEKLLKEITEQGMPEKTKDLCNSLMQKTAEIRRELETLGSKEHQIEEAKKTEVKEIKEEEKEISGLTRLVDELKDLEQRLISILEKRDLIAESRKTQVKL